MKCPANCKMKDENSECKFESCILPDDPCAQPYKVMLGNLEVSPHVFEDIECWDNCTVYVSECKKCGKVEVSWKRTENTERIF